MFLNRAFKLFLVFVIFIFLLVLLGVKLLKTNIDKSDVYQDGYKPIDKNSEKQENNLVVKNFNIIEGVSSFTMDIISPELNEIALELVSPTGEVYDEEEIKKNIYFEYRPGISYKIIKANNPHWGEWQVKVILKKDVNYTLGVEDSRRIYLLEYEQ